MGQRRNATSDADTGLNTSLPELPKRRDSKTKY